MGWKEVGRGYAWQTEINVWDDASSLDMSTPLPKDPKTVILLLPVGLFTFFFRLLKGGLDLL